MCGAEMVLGWNVFEDDTRSIGFDLYPSQYQEGLHLHAHGGKGLCQGQLCNWQVRLPFSS